jgi:DNA-binding response OmpR family regulator
MAFRRKGTGTIMVPDNPNQDKTILFADDDSQVQRFVAAVLHKNGYQVIAANDGTSALEKAREFHGVIHLLLADVEMPGMTGIELAIQISQDRPETKILLISGLDAGMLVLNNGWQFLPKPFMADMLRDRVRDFLSEQPSLKDHLASVQKLEVQTASNEELHLAEGLAEALPVVPVNGAPSLE